ncbi:hypothetical protein L248_2167 [Schleiferilactobacillus shenzhenensis LY-73]|uniref:Uncharacterized protein n=1 Tax=Schleiferilactobacillus shenzhenensis LY-73 TaxID=1231336 RepID=U4TQN2_9LACO|nr:hypothetical protein L248_2167 [Schleiferilactobacillus shenzhenensis LY-73]
MRRGVPRDDEGLFRSRLHKLVTACRDHQMIGQWNDGGRLRDDD